MRLLLALAFLALVSGCLCCIPPGDDQTGSSTTTIQHKGTTTTTTQKRHSADIKDRESCEALGGRWGRIGPETGVSCNLPTSDGGKECSDSSECEGACNAELSKADQEKAMHGEAIRTKGKCTMWRITVGCQARVENGRVHGLLCVD